MANRYLSLSIAIVLAAAAAACDSAPASPAAPSPTPAAATSPVAPPGATIGGTVGLGTGTSAMSESVSALASAGGAKVSVVGRSISATTDDSGRFELKDVPPGEAELRFEARGVDARLGIGAVASGQIITIVVQVQGQTAALARGDDRGEGVALRGAIEAVAGGEMRVAGRRVVTDSSTMFLDRQNASVGLSAFRIGDQVQVEGVSRTDGSVLAAKIKKEGADDNAPGGAPANFVGTISSLNPLMVAGRTVVTTSSTRILDRQNNPITLSALVIDGVVEVEGTTQADGRVLASKIKQKNADDNVPGGAPVYFVGTISSLNPLMVAGRTVVTTSSTRILDRQNNPITLSAFAIGGVVEVEGTTQADGRVLASKIKQENADDNAPGGAPVNFVGALTNKTPLVVAGRAVVTDADTRILDGRNNPISLAALPLGGLVEVEGTLRADNTVLAKKIKQQD